MEELLSLLRSEIARHDTGWSVGSFGAIGEFHRDEDEPLVVNESLTLATGRGAIRVVPHPAMCAVAYETLSPRPHRWAQGVALCLPEPGSEGARRSTLSEIGPDSEAICLANREDILFDIGLAQPQIDFCVRTSDAGLIQLLRNCVGQPTFATEAGSAILAAHPHRVVISKLGRVEVYQKIGGPDTGGKSPSGPHTHVLPKLLASGRTHSANTPIPDGLVPCAFLYPASPVMTPLGEDKDFDATRFSAFQDYLRRFGIESYVRTKQEVWAALDAGRAPCSTTEPETRLTRTAMRNALRQMARISEGSPDDRRSRLIAEWRAEFDKLVETADDE